MLVGYWDRWRKLRYASHVGSGFDERALAQVKGAAWSRCNARRCPFADEPELNAPTTWVEPETVAEVSFQSWTDDDHSARAGVPAAARRHRSEDGAARPQRRPRGRRRDRQEPPSTTSSRSSTSTKTAFTLAVGPHRIQPHQPRSRLLARRSGAQASGVHQARPARLPRAGFAVHAAASRRPPAHDDPHARRHPRPAFLPEALGAGAAGVRRDASPCSRRTRTSSTTTCSATTSRRCLWLAQSGTLEFHVWHSRAKLGPRRGVEEHRLRGIARIAGSLGARTIPTTCCSIIDPYIYSGKEAKGAEPELNTVAFEKGKEVAFWLRELLQGMSLEPIVKTSGKTGLHVFVPIRRTLDFDAARHVSELVGRHLHAPASQGHHAGVERAQADGQDLHGLQHERARQDAATSPIRRAANPGAPVSMPLTWDELAGAHPLDFTIANAPERLGPDRRPLARCPDAQAGPREGAGPGQGLTEGSSVSRLQREPG